jgi:hypothetical protein
MKKEHENKMSMVSVPLLSRDLSHLLDLAYVIDSFGYEDRCEACDERSDFIAKLWFVWVNRKDKSIFKNYWEGASFVDFSQRLIKEKGYYPFDLDFLFEQVLKTA